jgi:2'-5' RNA ligase
MSTSQSESAIVVTIALPPALERLRRRNTEGAALGIPAHVTVLYPFAPPALLSPTIRNELARLAATESPFNVRFTHAERWPGVVWLAPEPANPFARLTSATCAVFPGYPPYGGVFEDVIPHLTIGEGGAIDLATVHAAATRLLPFERAVSAITVLVEDPDGRWRVRWRLPFRR